MTWRDRLRDFGRRAGDILDGLTRPPAEHIPAPARVPTSRPPRPRSIP